MAANTEMVGTFTKSRFGGCMVLLLVEYGKDAPLLIRAFLRFIRSNDKSSDNNFFKGDAI